MSPLFRSFWRGPASQMLELVLFASESQVAIAGAWRVAVEQLDMTADSGPTATTKNAVLATPVTVCVS